MAPLLYKFGRLVGDADHRHEYANTFETERTTGPLRLAIAPSGGHVALLKELSEQLPEPLGILYVLVVPRGDHEPGRYQSSLFGREDVSEFFSRFRHYLEGDGRHNLWLVSPRGGETIVYDRHNVLFAYGPIEAYERVLRRRGLVEGQVRFPDPHSHHYHESFDADETAILEYWNWKRFPLVEGVDVR